MIGRPMSSNAEIAIAHAGEHVAQQRHASVGAVDGDPGRLCCGGLRKQAEHRGRNDAQRALRTDEHLFHIVAGIVLAQSAQTVPDAAVWQHHLEPHDQRSCIAIAQHLNAAGVGRDVAADLTGAFSAET